MGKKKKIKDSKDKLVKSINNNVRSITISEDMVGHKLGEFSPTRQFFGHTPADKKAKQVAQQKPEVKKNLNEKK